MGGIKAEMTIGRVWKYVYTRKKKKKKEKGKTRSERKENLCTLYNTAHVGDTVCQKFNPLYQRFNCIVRAVLQFFVGRC